MKKSKQPGGHGGQDDDAVVGLRIIGGTLRGRRLQYSGEVRTRPMKDRVRESVFNLLGPDVKGSHAVDLFAGTGALGLEALSRGAARATFVERHYPTAQLVEQNIADLKITGQTNVAFADAFHWTKNLRLEDATPLTVFCSPPYDFYVERQAEMLDLVSHLAAIAPAGSQFVVEADERFDFALLAGVGEWDIRQYPPAVVGILAKA